MASLIPHIAMAVLFVCSSVRSSHLYFTTRHTGQINFGFIQRQESFGNYGLCRLMLAWSITAGPGCHHRTYTVLAHIFIVSF